MPLKASGAEPPPDDGRRRARRPGTGRRGRPLLPRRRRERVCHAGSRRSRRRRRRGRVPRRRGRLRRRRTGVPRRVAGTRRGRPRGAAPAGRPGAPGARGPARSPQPFASCSPGRRRRGRNGRCGRRRPRRASGPAGGGHSRSAPAIERCVPLPARTRRATPTGGSPALGGGGPFGIRKTRPVTARRAGPTERRAPRPPRSIDTVQICTYNGSMSSLYVTRVGNQYGDDRWTSHTRRT